jgi:diguanylate cyclase (GGDEF)-like protein
MRWTVKKTLYLGYALAGSLTIVSASIALISQDQGRAIQADILKSNSIVKDLAFLLISSMEITMNQRAFIINGDKSAIADLPERRLADALTRARVAKAIDGDPELTLHFQKYMECTSQRHAFVDKLNRVLETQGFEAARGLEATKEDDRLLACTRAEINAILIRIQNKLSAQEAANRKSQQREAEAELMTVLLMLALLAGIGANLAEVAVENRQLYDKLVYYSNFDRLTDIPNRLQMEHQLEKQLVQCANGSSQFAILYIDLDHFKQVNDLHGHAIGDLYLQRAAQRMGRQLRPDDLLARIGGDEFIVLLAPDTSSDRAEEIALRLEHCFARPFSVGDILIHGGASIGIAMYPIDGADAHALVQAADQAMYSVKHRHHGNMQQSPTVDNEHRAAMSSV